jgi:8-oxo-dGTP pyrophosphatase MutT (NUDIX family)
VLRPHEELELLLIKRAERESDPWSGHIALPGGRRDPADTDLIATAFRETAEETGVAAHRGGRLLGGLDEVHPRNPRLPSIVVAPFVIGVPAGTTAHPDPREVDAALWVPLSALRDPGAVSEILIELEDGRRAYPSLRYRDYVIWGLTHRIVTQFLEVVGESGL